MSALRTPGIDAQVRVLFNPSVSSVNVMVPGLIAFVLLLSATLIMSQSVVRERERGTLEQLFVTPINRWEYLLGKMAPYALVATLQITIVFLVGILWFRVPFNGSLLVVATGGDPVHAHGARESACSSRPCRARGSRRSRA